MKNDIIIVLASYLIFAEVGLAIGYLLKIVSKREWLKYLIIILLAGLLAYFMSRLVGMLFYDNRPYIELHKTAIISIGHDNGFPSDHMLIACLTASIVFLKNRRFGLVLWGLAVLVGLGRVLALAHHPVDVIVSAIIAIVATAMAYLAYIILDETAFKRLDKDPTADLIL